MKSNKEEMELSNCTTVSSSKKATMIKAPPKPRKVKEPKEAKEPKKPATTIKSAESPTSKPKRKKSETKKATKETDRKILVAVDFGTTFSGIAWAQTRKPEVQTLIQQWPDATSESLEGVSDAKVPTEIAYYGNDFKWGYQIQDSAQKHQWFKLDLDPSQIRDSPLAPKSDNSTCAPAGYDPSKLVTDFLKALRTHTERVLRHGIPASALLSAPIEYVITVPALWSDIAQATTRACADAAGMGAGAALHVISEPEAAALYALNTLDPHGLKIGDTFMICDAGGGTVDLITYKVASLNPILKLAEASPGSGSLCGSSFLNRGFQDFLEKRLGNQPGWDEEVLEEAMRRFESIVKRQFRGTVGEEFQIPVPGLRDNSDLRIRKNKMTLIGAEVKAIFDPVVKEVLNLVKGQIDAAKRQVKTVILVGGFGQNAYLRDAIREEVISSKVDVLQSPNAQTAVVRGALMTGLASTSPEFATVKISGRSARKHYGINCGIPYSQEHGNARKVWDACSGLHRTYMMDWFIEKGNQVKEDDPVRLSYHKNRLVSRGPFTTISTTIYCCRDSNNSGAPKHVEDGNSSIPAEISWIDQLTSIKEGVTELVKVEADLTRILEKKIPKTKGADGKTYYKLDYVIQITHRSAYTNYELIYGGVNYGLVTAEYV